MTNPEIKQQFIIAGPCAAESRSQVLQSAHEVKEQRVDALRASLWKPRTCPDFEGVGKDGITWLAEAAAMGIIVATEVMTPQDTRILIEKFFEKQEDARLIVWLGSRNQNHIIQREIASSVNGDSRVWLMIKNQPWSNEKHWLGIHEHVLSANFPEKRIIHCHRGFDPSDRENPMGFRNLPDFEMAMRVREKTKSPMILDPSHIGGSVKNVFEVVKQSLPFCFDGFMIETHPNPKEALTDTNQQLDTQQLNNLLSIIRQKRGANAITG